MSLSELCELAVDSGYQAICLRPSQVSIHCAPEKIAVAAETIRDRGLSVSMISGDVDIVYNNDRGPNCLRNIRPHLQLAAAFGATMIRVCIKSMDDLRDARRAADQAAEFGCTLLQQCHVQSPFETVDQIEDNLRRIDRPNFGLIYEAANLQQCGQDYGAVTIARLAPWIRNVYLQNQRLSVTGGVTLDNWTHGKIAFDVIEIPDNRGLDFKAIMAALTAGGYDGPITVHQSAPQDGTSCQAAARRTAAYLLGLR
jgi:sugar phosphate isomerase/epimerase